VRYTLRFSSGAHDARSWASAFAARQWRTRYRHQYPELGRIAVVPYTPPEHGLSPGHERAGG